MGIVALEHLVAQLPTAEDDPEAARFGDLDAVVVSALRYALETGFALEVEQHLGCRLYQRSEQRQDYRNGSRFRDIVTRHGVLEQVRIPRLRQANYLPAVLTKHQRVLDDACETIGKCLLCGASRAEVAEMVTHLLGYPPAASLIGKVERTLEEKAKAFKIRPLTGTYQYLLLDGVRVTLQSGLRGQRRTVLVAVGITVEGTKEILGFERVARENKESWRGFLRRLTQRGLAPQTLSLVISDEQGGIVAAVPEVLGDVAHQLCWAHRMRNAYESVNKEHQKAVVEDLREVYRAPSAKAARANFLAFARRWRERYPSLVHSLEEDLGQLLCFFACPPAHWCYVRTSNGIERLFRDVRARTISFAGFASPARCDRWLFGIFWQANQRWQKKTVLPPSPNSTHNS